ncbi:hypothetical protein D3C86_2184960 [compost metagenome]
MLPLQVTVAPGNAGVQIANAELALNVSTPAAAADSALRRRRRALRLLLPGPRATSLTACQTPLTALKTTR